MKSGYWLSQNQNDESRWPNITLVAAPSNLSPTVRWMFDSLNIRFSIDDKSTHDRRRGKSWCNHCCRIGTGNVSSQTNHFGLLISVSVALFVSLSCICICRGTMDAPTITPQAVDQRQRFDECWGFWASREFIEHE